MSTSIYEMPEWARGFTGFLRLVAYQVTHIVGLVCAVFNALVFLIGPGMWRSGDIPNTFMGAFVTFIVIAVLVGISVGCYFALSFMRNRWPGISAS